MTSLQLNNGNTIPILGLGFWETPDGQAAELSYQGLKDGYHLIDTAQVYGNEGEVCDGIVKWLKEDPSHKRESLFYTTKIFDRDHGYEKTKKAIELSLKRAKGMEYIDLILMHSPQSNYEKRHGSWMALQEAVASGKVKNIGVSNYGIKHLKELLAYPDLKVKPVVDQLELHPWLTRDDLVKYCKDNGIVAEAYSPLTRARKFDDKDLIKIGKKYGKSPAQILIRWSLQMGFVPLPKTVHKNRLTSNLDVFDFKLTSDEVKTLKDKDEYLVFCWDPVKYPLDSERK